MKEASGDSTVFWWKCLDWLRSVEVWVLYGSPRNFSCLDDRGTVALHSLRHVQCQSAGMKRSFLCGLHLTPCKVRELRGRAGRDVRWRLLAIRCRSSSRWQMASVSLALLSSKSLKRSTNCSTSRDSPTHMPLCRRPSRLRLQSHGFICWPIRSGAQKNVAAELEGSAGQEHQEKSKQCPLHATLPM